MRPLQHIGICRHKKTGKNDKADENDCLFQVLMHLAPKDFFTHRRDAPVRSSGPTGQAEYAEKFFLLSDREIPIEQKQSKVEIDKLVKSHFANDIEQFWKKIRNEPGVKNFKLFEGDSSSF